MEEVNFNERQAYKGRVYGLREMKVVPSYDGRFRVEPERILNKGEIYENNIKRICDEIVSGIHPMSAPIRNEEGEIVDYEKSYILEDASGVKYEMNVQDDGTVLVDELDSDGIESVATRRYTVELLAKLIYTRHFAFNSAGVRESSRVCPELSALECNKFWN